MKVMADKLPAYRLLVVELVCLANFLVNTAVAIGKRHEIDDEMKSAPKWRFVAMAVLDTAMLMLLLIPARSVPATLVVLLLQSGIPSNLLVSATATGSWRRYHWRHHVGAIFVVGGVVMAGSPLLFKGAMGSENATVLTACGLFAASTFAGALSTAYKESVLRKAPMDPSFLNAWTSAIQCVLVLIFAPAGFALQDLPGALPWSDIAWNRIDASWGNGTACLFGNTPSSAQDSCEWAWVVFAAYVLCSLCGSSLIESIVRAYNSAAPVYVASTASSAAAFVALGVYSLDGGALTHALGSWEPFSAFGIAGAVAVLCGTALYQSKDEPGVVAETPYPDNPATVSAAAYTQSGALH